MSYPTTMRLCRLTAMALYFLAGFTVWFAANAWIFVSMNHHAIESLASQLDARTEKEASEIKWGPHE